MTSDDAIDLGNDPVRRAHDFYARVGRVVAHAALMEQWLFYLADTLDRASRQDEIAGTHGSKLVELCRDHLDVVPELRSEIEQLLAAIDEVLTRRNTVVHSVSVQPGDPHAYAHRPLPKRQRDQPENWIGESYLTAEFLDQLAADIDTLIARLMSVRPRAEPSS